MHGNDNFIVLSKRVLCQGMVWDCRELIGTGTTSCRDPTPIFVAW